MQPQDTGGKKSLPEGFMYTFDLGPFLVLSITDAQARKLLADKLKAESQKIAAEAVCVDVRERG